MQICLRLFIKGSANDWFVRHSWNVIQMRNIRNNRNGSLVNYDVIQCYTPFELCWLYRLVSSWRHVWLRLRADNVLSHVFESCQCCIAQTSMLSITVVLANTNGFLCFSGIPETSKGIPPRQEPKCWWQGKALMNVSFEKLVTYMLIYHFQYLISKMLQDISVALLFFKLVLLHFIAVDKHIIHAFVFLCLIQVLKNIAKDMSTQLVNYWWSNNKLYCAAVVIKNIILW